MILNNSEILVIGDVMLDRYWYGVTNRISPEAPVPIVNMISEEDRLGGAGNVAMNLVNLNIQTKIIGLIGSDDNGAIVNQLLLSNNISSILIPLPEFVTITKLRILSSNQQCIRVDFEKKIVTYKLELLIEKISQEISNAKVVILSDYNKGTLLYSEKIIEIARVNNIPIVVDPKGLKFEKYRGATIITPNLSEFLAVVGKCDNEGEIETKAQHLINLLDLNALLLTRGEHGMTLFEKDMPPYHLSAVVQNVFDVTGAGDTVVATLSACLASNIPLRDAVKFSNIAAGIVVSKIGTTPVTLNELQNEIINQLKS